MLMPTRIAPAVRNFRFLILRVRHPEMGHVRGLNFATVFVAHPQRKKVPVRPATAFTEKVAEPTCHRTAPRNADRAQAAWAGVVRVFTFQHADSHCRCVTVSKDIAEMP